MSKRQEKINAERKLKDGEKMRKQVEHGCTERAGYRAWLGIHGCNAAAVLIFLLAMALVHHRDACMELFSALVEYPDAERDVTSEMTSEGASLRLPYSLNYTQLLRTRAVNMARYNFSHSTTGVDRRANLSLQEFYDVYDHKWPVLLTDVVPKWGASNWTRDFLVKKYGDQRVVMKAVNGKLGAAESLALPLELFHRHTHQAQPDMWTYLEDELFITQRPELYRMIGPTPYLEENFFHSFPAEVAPWDAMLLWGTAYSRSSLHIDPYNWTGTNAVLAGRKRWKLYPPGQDDLLYVKRGRLSGFPLNCYKYNSHVDAFDVSHELFPEFSKAHALEFDQLPGELLIIPTGWFHQAYNVEETMAISSQVMNRNNYRVVLEEILKVTANLLRADLPAGIDSLPPQRQVERVMGVLPQYILQRGASVTQDALKQIRHGMQGEALRTRTP